MDKKNIKVKASEGKGYVTFASKKKPTSTVGNVEELGNGRYRLFIDQKEEVVIEYE